MSESPSPSARLTQPDFLLLSSGGETGALMLAHDWSTSPLGTPDTWPPSLRGVVSLLLGSKFPMFVLWGAERILVYNDAYVPILGKNHPGALGRPFFDVWPEVRADIAPIVDEAFAGEASFFEDLPVVLERTGKAEQAYFTFSYSPVRDHEGAVVGAFCVCAETTSKVLTEDRTVEERERLRRMFEQAPGFMAVLREPEHVFELVNAAYMQMIGHRNVVGKRVREALPEVEGQGYFELLDQVYRTGEAFTGNAMKVGLQRASGGPIEERFVDFVFQPITDANGEVTGIFSQGSDVTARIQAEAEARESETFTRLLLNSTSEAFYAVDRDGVTTLCNDAFMHMLGFDRLEDVVGRRLHDIIHHSHPDGSHYPGNECPIYLAAATGKASLISDELFFRLDGSSFPVEYRAEPILRKGQLQGAICTFVDITERKRTEAALRESEENYRHAAELNPQVAWTAAPDGKLDRVAERWRHWTGASGLGETWAQAIHPEDLKESNDTWASALATGDPYDVEHRVRLHGGDYHWMHSRAFPRRNAEGRILKWYGTTEDIHDRKLAEAALIESRDHLESESHALEVLNRSGTEVAAELEIEKVVQLVVDAGVEITGAQIGAFFYAVVQDSGESLMLYSLSGAKLSDFAHFGMPRATPVFAPTFRGEGVIRSGNILKDERYGKNPPHSGMPEGHLPVRSFLSVPVISRTGEVLGGLFFGHADTDVFTERSERLMTGLAGQATIAIDNARLFQSAQRANETLEHRVAQRTAELEQAHEALRQAQKMEAVGQLTGGIAHDFNNMLSVVIGSLDLLGRRMHSADARFVSYVNNAKEGARRAAMLTQRLLAFSRQQALKPEPMDANKLVGGMSDLLRGSLGSDIRLETVLAGGLWRTHADPNQLESVVLNLAVNARDAMPEGGRLTIETQNAHLDARYAAAHIGVAAGQYVLIAVTDTGFGMPEDVIARAFDPFFTTKEVGKGTGLGLSQVYGFVKQSGGHVKVYSEAGQGTTVKVYLPRFAAADLSGNDDVDVQPAFVSGEPLEVVLVVEDEPAVRRFSIDALSELGYRVLDADGAATALRILDVHPEVTLLFTDIVMPDVNGRKLADEARRRRPDLKVLFTTGFTRNAVVHNGVLDPGVHLIGKPFTLDELAAKVREVIDSP